jgi:translation initiation factor 2B subunit (eIF-2B alpha/beta/delta family)
MIIISYKEVIYMPRHTVYLSESDNKILKELKEKHGSVSNVIRISLHKLREEQLKEYYTNKAESYSELRKAQQKVIKRQEKEEQS